MDGQSNPNGRMMTTEWSFPRLHIPQQKSPKTPSWTRWVVVALGILSIIGLVPVAFCLVLLAMGAMTLVTELLSLLCAALVLIVSVLLLGLWATANLMSTRSKRIAFGVCGGIVGLDGCFGFATWIVLIVKRADIRDPLDSLSGVALGRERIIAIGFACWVLVLMTQIAFSITLALFTPLSIFQASPRIDSITSPPVLSPSNSAIPMRRATIHHHPSIASLAPSHFSHRAAHSWTSPPTSPSFPHTSTTMPIANLSTSPSLKPQSSLPNFPLPPTTLPLRSTGSVSSLHVTHPKAPYPSSPLAPFPFPNSLSNSTVSLPASPPKKPKRNSGILKSLTIRPESPLPRKKPSLSSLPTSSFPSLSPRKRFKSLDGSISSLQHSVSDITVWDDWDEDPRVKERVEMSFESVRMEKSEIASPRAVGLGIDSRNVSGGSASVGGVGTPLVGTPGELGWMSPASVLKGGFKWS